MFSFKNLAALMAVAGLGLAAGCSRQDQSTPVATAPAAERTSSQAGPSFAADLPREGGPPGYTGSEACRACHAEQFTSWHRSYHRTMTQIAAPDTVRANFHNIVLTNENTRFSLSARGNEFWVRMERVTTEGARPEPVDVRLGLVTGSHHMQVFWVPTGEGNTQVGFPFTWLIPEARWVPRNSTFIRPPDAPHRPEVWNVVCSRCHATGVEPRVDAVARTMDTRAGELGISCEACHGPGERHVNQRLAERDKTATPDALVLAREIVHPEKIDPARASQICGFCHSMKWFDRSENWRQNGFRFRPGDDLEETTPVIRPSQVGAIPEVAAYLSRNPNLLQDFFWPDGMIRVSGREYNGLIESPCYKKREFSCLSCHSLHKSDPDDLLARNRTGDAACTQCHESFREEARLLAHTRHKAGSSGSECYNCHMPHTIYGVLKAIRSHQVTSPRVADELATGRPNACNLCHLDKTLRWTADHLAEWHRQPRPALPAKSEEISQAVRLAISGDAGQRALMAWHLGWKPALHVSGTNWIAPVLGRLLDDPYAAVRCVAERSLKQVAPGLVPPGYDYAQGDGARFVAGPWIAERWSKATPAAALSIPPATLVGWENFQAMQKQLDELARERNESPVRLRE